VTKESDHEETNMGQGFRLKCIKLLHICHGRRKLFDGSKDVSNADSMFSSFWRLVILCVLVQMVRGESSVLILAQVDTNRSTLSVMSFSEHGRTDIARPKGNLWYGADGDSAAFLELGSNVRLLVIDRKTSAIVADRILDGYFAAPLKISVAECLAVRSKDSTVYFSGSSKQDGDGFFEANWKTGKIHRVPSSSADDIGSYKVTALPSGFFAVSYNGAVTLEMPVENGWGKQVYYVPALGLMENYNGRQRQLTDDSFATLSMEAKEFPTPRIATKVFSRNIHGKPHLIWGESKDAKSRSMDQIVVLDAQSGKDVLRQHLDNSFSLAFQPNFDAGHVHLIKSETGEVVRLDLETRR
jgi:hypothetical protein